MARIKTKLRNRLNILTVDSLMMIASNGPELHDEAALMPILEEACVASPSGTITININLEPHTPWHNHKLPGARFSWRKSSAIQTAATLVRSVRGKSLFGRSRSTICWRSR